MLTTDLSRLVNLGYATYQRFSVGLSSHSVIVVPKGKVMCITSLEVLPWAGIARSGSVAENPRLFLSADSSDQYGKRVSEAESYCDVQMNVLQDSTSVSSMNMRATIKYDSSALSGDADNPINTIGRGFVIPPHLFATQFWAKEQFELSFAQLARLDNGLPMMADVYPFDTAYNKDKLPTSGLNGTAQDVNNYNVLVGEPYYLVYSNFSTQAVAPANAIWKLSNVIRYPLGLDSSPTNPIYYQEKNPGDLTTEFVTMLTNLPIVNVEAVLLNGGTQTAQGWYSPEIQKALGWI